MSRSKRAPIITEGYGGSWRRQAKRAANKKVRKARSAQLGLRPTSLFKSLYNSWNICDYKFKGTRKDERK